MNDDFLHMKIKELSKVYASKLPHRIATLSDAWDAILANPLDVESWETFRSMAHSLAGSGSTFGFQEVSEISDQLQILADEIAGSSRILTSQEITKIKTLLARMQSIVTQPE